MMPFRFIFFALLGLSGCSKENPQHSPTATGKVIEAAILVTKFEAYVERYHDITTRQRKGFTVPDTEIEENDSQLLILAKSIKQISTNSFSAEQMVACNGLNSSISNMVRINFAPIPSQNLNAVDDFYSQIQTSNPLEREYVRLAALKAKSLAISNHMDQIMALDKPFEDAITQARSFLLQIVSRAGTRRGSSAP